MYIKGPELPSDPEECRHWLIEHQQAITKGLEQVAKELEQPGEFAFPIRRDIATVLQSVSMKLTMSGMVKVPIQEFSRVLRDLAGHWEHDLKSMERFLFEVF